MCAYMCVCIGIYMYLICIYRCINAYVHTSSNTQLSWIEPLLVKPVI